MACSPLAAFFPLAMQRTVEPSDGVGLEVYRCIAVGFGEGTQVTGIWNAKISWQNIFRVSVVSVLIVGFISDQIC